ncbi:MAG TPA: ABC transporter ATP-binding protein [Firmicutes bacterium]|nr:ABC transporter ATP-binding protein [Bacillota bacterium]
MPVLQIKGLTKFFGGLRAVHDFDITLEEGDLVGLIGPNGAGKTTVFNMITGMLPPSQGEVWFQGKNITGMPPFRVNQLGIARTFQNIRLFAATTGLNNVLTPMGPRIGYRLGHAALQTRAYLRGEEGARAYARELLRTMGLQGKEEELARNLPYGMQRRLEIARALAGRPRLLLLDEPAAGMNPAEVAAMVDLIRFVREKFGLTVLLIEHQMGLVMNLCPHIVVMDFGEIIARGTPAEIQHDEWVLEAYLGRRGLGQTREERGAVG